MEKATISQESGEEIRFQFNPETLKFTKAANWPEESTQTGQDGGNQQFTGTKPIELGLDMILDDTVGSEPAIADRVRTMLNWTNPVPDSDPPEPPTLTLRWGRLQIGLEQNFECHCQSVDVDYQMFRADGTPIRAKVTIKLKGVPTVPEEHNPTSGALAPLRSHHLRRGDDVAVIARREYGSTKHWRAIAALNGIDNPFRLPVGRELVLPDRVELAGWRSRRTQGGADEGWSIDG